MHFHEVTIVENETNNNNNDVDNGNKSLSQLRSIVHLGVWFHFAKFYIIVMPFYCGAQPATIPISMFTGVVSGFILMWCVHGEFSL